MEYTTQELYKQEVRTIELTLTKNYESFEPDSATAEIKDKNNKILVSDHVLITSGNKIFCVVPLEITNNVGEYYILWKINKDSSVFRHRTSLHIESLDN